MQGARCLRSPSGVGDASVISGELFHMAFLGPAVRSRGLLATAAPSLFSRPAYRLREGPCLAFQALSDEGEISGLCTKSYQGRTVVGDGLSAVQEGSQCLRPAVHPGGSCLLAAWKACCELDTGEGVLGRGSSLHSGEAVEKKGAVCQDR